MPRPKNYIHRLQADLADRDAKLAAVCEELNHLRRSLDGPKYNGVEADGSRRDWMATADLELWIGRIRAAALYTEAEPEAVDLVGDARGSASEAASGVGWL